MLPHGGRPRLLPDVASSMLALVLGLLLQVLDHRHFFLSLLLGLFKVSSHRGNGPWPATRTHEVDVGLEGLRNLVNEPSV